MNFLASARRAWTRAFKPETPQRPRFDLSHVANNGGISIIISGHMATGKTRLAKQIYAALEPQDQARVSIYSGVPGEAASHEAGPPAPGRVKARRLFEPY